jgi:hypothetical protein
MLEGLVGVRARMAVFVAAGVLVLGVAACGSEDDGDGSGSGNAAARGDGGESSPQAQLKATYDDYVEDIRQGRWEQACDGISDAYVKTYVKQLGVSKSCAETVRRQFENNGPQPRPWISKVELKDARNAVGVSRFREDIEGLPLKFVLEDGKWKVDGPAVQAASRAGGS